MWTPLSYMAHENWSTLSPSLDIRILVLPMSTQSSCPSMLDFHLISFACSSSSNSVRMRESSAYKISHGLPVSNRWVIATRPMINTRGSGKSLGEYPLSHWTLNSSATNTHSVSGNFIHGLLEPDQPLNSKLAKSPPNDTPGYMMKCLFQIDKGRVHCFVDGMGYFL